MATRIIMPKMGLTMKIGTVGKWLKKEDDRINKGDSVVEVMTEKITNIVESKVEGLLLKIVAPEGTELQVGALMGVIGEQGENITSILASSAAGPPQAAKSVTAEPNDEPGAKIRISPVALRMAEENAIDFTRILGTGPGGRITKEDVQKIIAESAGLKEDQPAKERTYQNVIPYEGMRSVIGRNMTQSWSANAMVTHHVTVDMAEVLALRKQVNECLPDKDKISIIAILTKAVARALQIDPCLNASLIGNEIRIWKDIHIGMAIALPTGLIVPVIRDADTKGIVDINLVITDLAVRARKNQLSLDEISGATFTISNLGGIGSVDFFTPIINPPEVAILGIGRTVDKPAVSQEQIVVRPLAGLSLTFDHKVVDGAPAAKWLGLLIGLIENPIQLLI